MTNMDVINSFKKYDSMDISEEHMNFFEKKMEDLSNNDDVVTAKKLPTSVQYGVKLPFRVAVIGQTDSGKTHSIIRHWLGGRISFWKYNIDGELTACQLQHCLYCGNGGMSTEEKQRLKDEFIEKDQVGMPQQRLFHLNRLPSKKDLLEFIASTSNEAIISKKESSSHERDKHGVSISGKRDIEQIIFSETENNSPNHVVVMDDLMNEAFNSRDKEVTSTMNLLMTKLSHHNNLSVSIVYQELYPKGPNSVLLREQLTGVHHLHSVANSQKARNYVHTYLTDNNEKAQYNQLFKEHILDIVDGVKGKHPREHILSYVKARV